MFHFIFQIKLQLQGLISGAALSLFKQEYGDAIRTPHCTRGKAPMYSAARELRSVWKRSEYISSSDRQLAARGSSAIRRRYSRSRERQKGSPMATQSVPDTQLDFSLVVLNSTRICLAYQLIAHQGKLVLVGRSLAWKATAAASREHVFAVGNCGAGAPLLSRGVAFLGSTSWPLVAFV